MAGKKIFASAGCAGCHTFKAAGSTGKVGPDLDAVSASPGRVLLQLRKPGGIMPSFAGKLSEKQKADVAAFVGAGRASGKAVAAPFAPDGKRLHDCARGQHRVPRAVLRQPDLQRGSEEGARAAADDDHDEHRGRRRLPSDRPPHGLGGADALSRQGRARVHRRLARLRVGLLPRDHRARLPRSADRQARRRRAPAVQRLADHRPAVPAVPVHPRPRARADDLHRLRHAGLAEDLRWAARPTSTRCPAAAACSWRTSTRPTA